MKSQWFKNNAPNTLHLKAREAGQPFFAFHPQEVIQAADKDEADLLSRTEYVQEVDEPQAAVAPATEEPAPGKKKKKE